MRTEKCRNAGHHICTCMCDHIGSCPAVFCVRSLFECVQITHICEPDDNWTAAILAYAFRSVHHSRFSRSRQQWIAFSSPQKTTHMPTDINIHYIFPTHTHTHTPIISTYDRVIVTMKLFQLGERPKLVRTNCVSTRFVWVLVETACFMLFGVRLMRTQMWLSNTHTKRSRLWTRKDCVCVLVYVARSRARSAHPEYLIQYMLQNRSTSFLRNHFQSEAQQTDLTQCRILTITK